MSIDSLAPPQRFINKAATILAGESLSNAVDCSDGAPVFIHMPRYWTSTMLSFQVSPDGADANYNDLFDKDAKEILVNANVGTSVRLDASWSPVTYLKIRSGTRDNLVPQKEERVVVITIDTSIV